MVQDIQNLVPETEMSIEKLTMEKLCIAAPEKTMNSECDTASVRSSSYDTQGDETSSNSQGEAETDNEKDEVPRKKLISKPIVDGKTYTTILYEVIAGLDNPTTISYFQVDADQPRTRNGRFVIECHLEGKLYGTGEGSSKKAAKQLASELALKQLLKEMPSISEDVSRVRNGFPSRKKMRTRRRRTGKPERRQWRKDAYPSAPRFHNARPPCSLPLLEMQERRLLAMEYEMVNKMVQNIENLSSYLGFPGMTPYETSLLADKPSFLDRDDMLDEQEIYGRMRKLPPVPPHPFDRDFPIDSHNFDEPDTLEFMRKMRARSGKNSQSELSAAAEEFTPKSSNEDQTQV